MRAPQVTKSHAEQLVLNSNGLPFFSLALSTIQAKQQGCSGAKPQDIPASPRTDIADKAARSHTFLRTCALRPPGMLLPSTENQIPSLVGLSANHNPLLEFELCFMTSISDCAVHLPKGLLLNPSGCTIQETGSVDQSDGNKHDEMTSC